MDIDRPRPSGTADSAPTSTPGPSPDGRPLSQDASARALSAAWSIVPGIVLAGVGGGIVYPILPVAGIQAGMSPAFIGLVLAINRGSRVACDPLIGTWVDRFGGRRLIIWGLMFEVLVMAVYLLALPSGHAGLLFLLGRVFWGPAAGFVFIAGQTLALHAAGAQERGRIAAMVRTAQLSGRPLGMVIGGVLAGTFGDETAFAAGMVAAAIGAFYAWRTIPDLRAQAKHGFRWRSVVRELTRPVVLIVSSINLVGFFALQGLLLATLVLALEEKRITAFGWPAQTMAGVAMAFFLIAASAMTPMVGQLCDRLGRRSWVIAGGSVIVSGGFVVLAFAADPLHLALALVLMGVGMGSLTVPLLALLGDHIPADRRGSAVGAMQLFGDAGGTIGPIAGMAALAAWGVSVPFLGTAAVLLAVVLPLTGWLLRSEAHRRDTA